MLSLAWKKMLVVAAFAVASIVWTADVADAGWGSSGGSWGSSGGSWGSGGGSWGSSGGSSGGYVVRHGGWGSHGSSGGSWGGHWRPFQRLHRMHHRSHYSSGSSGGSWGSHGSSGGSYGSYGSHGGYSSHGSSGGVYYSAPIEHEVAPSDTPEVPVPPQASARDGSVTIAIQVPADAKVFINDVATSSTGEDRVYVSNGLAHGKRYRYTVRAELERDGTTIVKEESVVLTSGGRSELAMNFDAAAENVAEKTDAEQENPRTTLKVNVPADAKVSVLGVETNQLGSERFFHTDRLADGQSWDGYTVKAVVIRNGQPIELEKQVTLRGGQSQTLAFDFEAAELASRVSQATR